MGSRVIRPGEGEMAGGGPIRIRIIEDGSHTEHRLGLVEVTVPPGPAAPPQHIHREHDELFIVTAGKLRFTSGGEARNRAVTPACSRVAAPPSWAAQPGRTTSVA